jgi:hypothetical protein
MKSGISITKIWSDDDAVELKIESSDGKSVFTNTAYVGWIALEELVEGLQVFRNQIHGGIFDIQFGAFGPEYADGAFDARLHFQLPGTLRVSLRAQSEFNEFGTKTIASEATLFFNSEPVLLDNFVAELKALSKKKRTDAALAGV